MSCLGLGDDGKDMTTMGDGEDGGMMLTKIFMYCIQFICMARIYVRYK
jgi:hypothetical protein